MYAYDFEYDGQCLSSFGFIICSFVSSSGANNVTAGSNISFNKVMRNYGKQYSLVGTSYSDCISTSFDICKNPDLYNAGEMEISDKEFREIMRWLNRREFISFRLIDDNFLNDRCYYHATFNVEKLLINEVLYGLRLTMETDSPFGYGETQELTWEINNNTITYIDPSDEIGYIQPRLTIVCNEAGDLSLSNDQFDTPMVINNCISGERLLVDGENQILSSSISTHNLMDDFNYYFFKIGNTYNNRVNNITSSIPISLTMTYEPIIKNAP